MPRSRRLRPLSALLLAALAVLGCDVEWSGAEVGLETPAAARPADTAGTAAAEPELPPLPAGPLFRMVRVRPDGRATVLPAGRMTASGPAPLELPADPPDRWWGLFADSLRAPGTELPLFATGRRIGTLILGEAGEPVNVGCPSPADGRVLLPPGADPPPLAFAWAPPADAAAPPPEPPVRPASSRRVRVFGPILAERLFQEAGVERSFLARRAALSPVAFPGDTIPGMAATYLIGDTLAPVPPASEEASSLFFLARFDPSEGYVPVWSRVARYSDASGKLVLEHLDWLITGDGSRVEILRRVDAGGERLAAVRIGGGEAGGELAWTESGRCPVLGALGVARGGGPGPPSAAAGRGGP